MLMVEERSVVDAASTTSPLSEGPLSSIVGVGWLLLPSAGKVSPLSLSARVGSLTGVVVFRWL